MGNDIIKKKHVLTRRKFLQYSAGAGALLGAGSLLGLGGIGQAASAKAKKKPKTKRIMKSRTYIFNLSHLDTSKHDIILVAGKRRVKVNQTNPSVFKKAVKEHPIFRHVPEAHMTHHVTLDMPEDAIQLCYLQKKVRGKRTGHWTMAHMFYHLPESALFHARKRHLLQQGNGLPKVHVKWQRYGLTSEMIAAFNDPVGEAMLQDANSQATAMVAGHPELASGEPNSAAHIQNNIIGTQPATATLGDIIEAQGDDWCTMTPLVNPDTGQVAKNSQGDDQLLPEWSQFTGQFAGQAIAPALDTAKNDTTLGTNVSTLDPTTENANTNGTIWAVQDGQASVNQSGLQATEELPFQFKNQSPGHGYSLEIEEVGINSSGTRTITFSAKNWFVRYLSLYVRYLDGNGQPIPISQIQSQIQSSFPLWSLGFNGTYDAFLDMVNPEFCFMGIPCKVADVKKTIPVPQQAATVLILAGGLGSGGNPFPDTVPPGCAMTATFNIAVPALMISLAAAAGFGFLVGELEAVQTLHEVLEEVVPFLEALVQVDMYGNPEVFIDLAVEIGQMLLSSGGEKVDELIAEAIAEGEAIEAVEDAIPIVGAFLSALWAISLVAQITETSAQVAQSPRTYIDEIDFTHDVTVTISHDPCDPAGFPATAKSFTVTALFDGGSPRTITQTMPTTTTTTPVSVTFKDVPAGGRVKVDVGFYSDTNFLVGHGSVGPVENDPDLETQELTITIQELLVPITSSTTYSHKEKIQLDTAGNHVWVATTTAPTVQTPQGICNNAMGSICSWTDITVSTINASVGYAWQSFNPGVTDCVSGGSGQLHQFANISITENPQAGYFFSNCGFSGTTRIVYDLMGKQGWNFYLDPTNGNNFIRQIRLAVPGQTPADCNLSQPTPFLGVSSYDAPNSNKAFGRLNFPSDALMLHPLGKIVSINTSLNKLEVLDLPPAAVADADAPLAQVRGGVGKREGLLDGPIHAALTAQGAIMILEQNNNRIQAFDIGGNPIPYFGPGKYFVPLRDPAGSATYLDLAVEYSGYLYVLSYTGSGPFMYRLDIYTPQGAWLARTTGINADKLAVNYWRDLFTLNYEVLRLPDGSFPNRTEPSVSHWIPSTPPGLGLRSRGALR